LDCSIGENLKVLRLEQAQRDDEKGRKVEGAVFIAYFSANVVSIGKNDL
jgi:hypothetical protein